MVFCLRFGTWNWPLPFKDNFLEAKLNVGKFPLGNLIVNNMFGHLLFSKWNYVKCSDVLQYHMMAKKKYIMTFNMVQQYVAMDMWSRP